MVVTIRSQMIDNTIPQKSYNISLADIDNTSGFVKDFEEVSNSAVNLAKMMAISIFADSAKRPKQFVLDNEHYMWAYLNLIDDDFEYDSKGKKLMDTKDAKKAEIELESIFQRILTKIGNTEVTLLIDLLMRETDTGINVGSNPKEDILSMVTYTKLKEEKIITSMLSDRNTLKSLLGEDYLKSKSIQFKEKEDKDNALLNSFDNSEFIYNPTIKKHIVLDSNKITIDTHGYIDELFTRAGYPKLDSPDFPFKVDITRSELSRREKNSELIDSENGKEYMSDWWLKEFQGKTDETIDDSVQEKNKQEEWGITADDMKVLVKLIDGLEEEKKKTDFLDYVEKNKVSLNQLYAKLEEIYKDETKMKKSEKLLNVINNTISILKGMPTSNIRGTKDLLLLERTFDKDGELLDNGYSVKSIFGFESKQLTLKEAYKYILEEEKKFVDASAIKKLIASDIKIDSDLNDLQDVVLSYLTPDDQSLTVGKLKIEIENVTTKNALVMYEAFEEYILKSKRYGVHIMDRGEKQYRVPAPKKENEDFYGKKIRDLKNEKGEVYTGKYGKDTATRYMDAVDTNVRRFQQYLDAFIDFVHFIEQSNFAASYQNPKSSMSEKLGWKEADLVVNGEDLLEMILNDKTDLDKVPLDTNEEKMKKKIQNIISRLNGFISSAAKPSGSKAENIENMKRDGIPTGTGKYGEMQNVDSWNTRIKVWSLFSSDTDRVNLIKQFEILLKLFQQKYKTETEYKLKPRTIKYDLYDLYEDVSTGTTLEEIFEDEEYHKYARIADTRKVRQGQKVEYKDEDGVRREKRVSSDKEEDDQRMLPLNELKYVPIYQLKNVEFNTANTGAGIKNGKIIIPRVRTTFKGWKGKNKTSSSKDDAVHIPKSDILSLSAASANYGHLVEGVK